MAYSVSVELVDFHIDSYGTLYLRFDSIKNSNIFERDLNPLDLFCLLSSTSLIRNVQIDFFYLHCKSFENKLTLYSNISCIFLAASQELRKESLIMLRLIEITSSTLRPKLICQIEIDGKEHEIEMCNRKNTTKSELKARPSNITLYSW